MASRTPKIEEVSDDFDDDFDLPLPNHPTPTAAGVFGGSSGAASSRAQHVPGIPHPVQQVTDTTPFKTYVAIVCSL